MTLAEQGAARGRGRGRGRGRLGRRGRGGGGAALVVDGDPVDVHRRAGNGRGGRGREAGDAVREAAAHGQVVDDEERVVDGARPGGGIDGRRQEGEEVVAVEVPADPLRRHRAVDLDRVVVVAGLAAVAGHRATAATRSEERRV